MLLPTGTGDPSLPFSAASSANATEREGEGLREGRSGRCACVCAGLRGGGGGALPLLPLRLPWASRRAATGEN